MGSFKKHNNIIFTRAHLIISIEDFKEATEFYFKKNLNSRLCQLESYIWIIEQEKKMAHSLANNNNEMVIPENYDDPKL